ncbi:MAG TPA: dipeptidase PepE, partial [Candidatus Polarisedimenticolia bacterium]|nr:dipeptidase PepE [Candidatus Polarisedimenticolia bacterium]
LFVPFALHDQARYWGIARDRFKALGIEVDRLEEGPVAAAAVEQAGGIFVGGGNTFRLLDRLQRTGALEPIRMRALGGMPYMGSSAGTVVAAPTLKTTNDMPIVQPASFDALGLVPFQINPHYLDPDPSSRHMGETREQRIAEFLEENDRAVLGLREGGMLHVDSSPGAGAANGAIRIRLSGATARVFRRGADPVEAAPGDRLEELLLPRG